jgi:hypothetical protein
LPGGNAAGRYIGCPRASRRAGTVGGKRTERTSGGLYTYYRATILAETIPEHSVEKLLRREWDFKERYSASPETSE